ncbi:hypothetical protein D3C81_1851180 [compost metagenome]
MSILKASSPTLRLRLPRPRSSLSARSTSLRKAGSSRLLSTYTRARESKALFSSKDGFSVVAPMKISVPSST